MYLRARSAGADRDARRDAAGARPDARRPRQAGQGAVGCYDAALKIDPENPVPLGAPRVRHTPPRATRKKARRLADSALNELAPIYRRTLELHHSGALVAMRDNTLAALTRTYDLLEAGDDVSRATLIQQRGTSSRARPRTKDVATLRALKAGLDHRQVWEREQVQIALARTLGRNGQWEQAAATSTPS